MPLRFEPGHTLTLSCLYLSLRVTEVTDSLANDVLGVCILLSCISPCQHIGEELCCNFVKNVGEGQGQRKISFYRHSEEEVGNTY